MNANENNVNTSANNANLLKRVAMFLEEKNWDKAYEYCERILDSDSECGEAYFFKLMADMKASKREELSNAVSVFENNINYTRVMQFGSEELKQELENYNLAIKARNENNRKDAAYRSALEVLNAAKGIGAFGEAKRLFLQISNWKDSREKIAYCDSKIEELKQQEAAANAESARLAEEARRAQEQERIEKEQRLAEKEQKKAEFSKKYKKPIILASVLVLIAVVAVLSVTVFIPMIKYNNAVKLYEAEKFDEAYKAFEKLGDYKDSKERMLEVRYSQALHTLSSPETLTYHDYKKLFELLNETDGYKDSEEIMDKYYPWLKYSEAIFLLGEQKDKEAYEIFVELGDFLDCEEYLKGFVFVYDKVVINADCELVYEYEYDSDWNIIKEVLTGDELMNVAHREYDSYGNITKEYFNDDVANASEWEYEYNSYGDIKRVVQKENGIISEYEIEYEYDPEGNVTKEVHTYSNNMVYTWEYDSYGNITKESQVNYNGYYLLNNTYEYEYDADGNITKKYIRDVGGTDIIIDCYEYAYDSKGNLIRESYPWSWSSDLNGNYVPELYDERTYTYIGEHIFYNADK